MEISSTLNFSFLINLLNEGNEQIRELEAQLDQPYSAEACRSLASQAQAAFSTAISMVKLLKQPESTLLAAECLQSKNSEDAFKEQERREVLKKRKKTMPRWNKEVRVCSGSSTMDDGYSWRKYGQKEILGSKFPRCYYRCTHRHTHGCPATKQVQRSDEDPSLFEVSFRGDHTCTTRDLRRIPAPPPEEHTNSPGTENLMIVPSDLQPSFTFSFPSSFCPSNDLCLPNMCWSGSQMAEMLSGATSMSTTSESLMESWDFALKEIDFDTEFLVDFSYK